MEIGRLVGQLVETGRLVGQLVETGRLVGPVADLGFHEGGFIRSGKQARSRKKIIIIKFANHAHFRSKPRTLRS